MLQINNIVKNYGTTTVLRIPFLQLDNGIYWIKGTNGSGKTTLLKMIAGLLYFEGDILVNNISIKKKPNLYRQQVSWSEAEPLFPSFMTGLDIIKLYSNIRKSSQKDADELVAVFNMQDYICNAIGIYSAGMTKKLSLLLSFIGNPSLIVLDEPLITLDADAVGVVSAYILERHNKKKSNFIISSHQNIDTHLLSFDKEFIIQNQTIIAL